VQRDARRGEDAVSRRILFGLVVTALVGLSSLAATVPGAPPPSASARLRMMLVLDPGCPQTVSMLERVEEFRRIRPEIPVRLLIPDPAGIARAGPDVISALQHGDLTLEWDPAELRALGVTVTPAVVVRDSAGQGVRATGVPDLVGVADAAGSR